MDISREVLSRAAAEFETDYRHALNACLKRKLPLTICTLYNGNFPNRACQRQVATALTVFNDVAPSSIGGAR